MFIAMLILHFIPGGKTAGQVPLRLALESLMKEEKMQGVDNEHEMEVLAKTQHTEVETRRARMILRWMWQWTRRRRSILIMRMIGTSCRWRRME